MINGGDESDAVAVSSDVSCMRLSARHTKVWRRPSDGIGRASDMPRASIPDHLTY